MPAFGNSTGISRLKPLLHVEKPLLHWRDAAAGGLTFARRARDTVCLPMNDCGDVCFFDGCSYAHEVRPVYGRKPRVSVAMTLACPKL